MGLILGQKLYKNICSSESKKKSKVTSTFSKFFAKSAVKKWHQFLYRNWPKWRHSDVISIFWVFFSFFYLYVKISAHLKDFYGNWFLTSNYFILTIFGAKWRHNDVTPKKNRFLPINFFLQLFGKFQHHWSFFSEVRGGDQNAPPPNSNGGYLHPNSNRVKFVTPSSLDGGGGRV